MTARRAIASSRSKPEAAHDSLRINARRVHGARHASERPRLQLFSVDRWVHSAGVAAFGVRLAGLLPAAAGVAALVSARRTGCVDVRPSRAARRRPIAQRSRHLRVPIAVRFRTTREPENETRRVVGLAADAASEILPDHRLSSADRLEFADHEEDCPRLGERWSSPSRCWSAYRWR